MKKLFLIIVAVIGLYSTSTAQTDKYIYLTVNENNCDHGGNVPHADVFIYLYEGSGCQGNPICYKEYGGLDLPISNLFLTLKPECLNVNPSSIRIVVRLRDSEGYYVCNSDDCFDFINGDLYVVFPD